jgi:hypothetical protein
MIGKFLNKYGSYGSIAICLTLIVWSFVEPNFYSQYISGEPYLVWTVYVLPWIIIIANLAWQFKWVDKIRNKIKNNVEK